MRYTVGCHLAYEVEAETVFIFNLEVARLERHRDLRETVNLIPALPLRRHVALETGNRYVAVTVPPGRFSLDYAAEVTLDPHRADPAGIAETPVKDLPLAILPYLLPSRFVSSDRLAPFAQAEFGDTAPGFARVTRICNWIHDHIAYVRGASDEETTADETLLKRAGVCRDFAHLGAAFCRALGIPARFVSCYADGLVPSDFHAVFEAYLDGRWWLFDATRQAHLDGLVRIGAGRDAAEIAFATPFGEMTPTGMEVRITRTDGAPETGERTVAAISTAETGPDAEGGLH
ncbi:transglutaminase-like domain-containing protein [Methylobacterium aquaticum]|uniref:transglutaminase-like domain-containing protein n=1 Tax=Methylobacterium aquaticum TaxID=270351 RepID=UPI003D16339E